MPRHSPRDERRRTFSQNFLEDRGLAEELASSVTESELVLEIGAGRGALTVPLASRGARVLAVERDAIWARRLEDRLRYLGLSADDIVKTAVELLAVAAR